MTHQPTISVVLCTYNGEKFLTEQLESILAQTYPPSEIIIQDDRSTDGTVDIIKAFAERHSIIRYSVNSRNLGYNLNFQTACAKATCDFIAISDQDDVWFSDKLACQVAQIGDNLICTSERKVGCSVADSIVSKPDTELCHLLFKGICGHTMLIKREFAQRADVWIHGIYYDWGLAAFAAIEGGLCKVDKPLNLHRLHDSQVTSEQYHHPSKVSKLRSYTKGFALYRQFQRTEGWSNLYTTIYDKTRTGNRLIHKVSGLLLKRDFISTVRLCFLCMANRKKLYLDPRHIKGPMGGIRGFFLPFIFAFHNNSFK